MDALRKAINRYADRLDQQARRHEAFAVILNSVAHRLRTILDNNPAPFMVKELAVKISDKYVLIEHVAGMESVATGEEPADVGTYGPVYVRWVTPWKETK